MTPYLLQVHPNTESTLTVEFGADLLATAAALVTLLRDTCMDVPLDESLDVPLDVPLDEDTVKPAELFRDPTFLAHASMRYVNFLRLKAKNKHVLLVPTLEIEYGMRVRKGGGKGEWWRGGAEIFRLPGPGYDGSVGEYFTVFF